VLCFVGKNGGEWKKGRERAGRRSGARAPPLISFRDIEARSEEREVRMAAAYADLDTVFVWTEPGGLVDESLETVAVV
jgi:hypothetical protein